MELITKIKEASKIKSEDHLSSVCLNLGNFIAFSQFLVGHRLERLVEASQIVLHTEINLCKLYGQASFILR